MIKFFILAIVIANFINTASFAKYPKATLNGPQDTMNFFLKTMKGHKLGDTKAINLAVKSINQSIFNNSTKIESAKLAAAHLINTLDRLEYIDIKKIPKNTSRQVWVYQKQNVVINGKLQNLEISIGKDSDAKWRFTPETVKTIHLFRKFVDSKKVVSGVVKHESFKESIKSMMPVWTSNENFFLMNGQWIAIFIIILICFTLEKVVRLYIGKITQAILQRKNISLSDKKEKYFSFPVGMMMFSAMWVLLVQFLELSDAPLAFFMRTGKVVFTFGAVMTVHHLVDLFSLYLEKLAHDSENKFDDILVPLVRKTAKFFVIIIGFVFVGNSLTFDMKSIIAGMGIGGLAFALAAKDTISNLFGSLTILLDRPFRIGDWIFIDGKIEGTVEEVGMRSCRIRTFYDSVITLPNGQLTNAYIDNYGQRTYRRYSTKLGIQYDTPPELIEAFCEGIRQIILRHKWTRKDYFHAYLTGMGESSLEILVYVFWHVPDWSTELAEKHRLLLDILRLGQKLGIQFAFPTQTLHLQRQNSTTYNELPKDKNSFELANEMAEVLANDPISNKSHRSGANGGKLPPGEFSL